MTVNSSIEMKNANKKYQCQIVLLIMDFKELIETDKVQEYLSDLDPIMGLTLAETHYQIARVYCRSFADIENSDQHYKTALKIFEEESDAERCIDCKRDIAVNRELVGEYEVAYQGFRECADFSMEINYVDGFTLAMGGIAVLYLHLNDVHNPRVIQVIEDIKNYNVRMPHDQLSEALQLGEALLGNASSKLRDQMKAQVILEELVENAKYPHNRWSAIRFLLMNYIDEMLLTRSMEHLDRAKALLKVLKPSAENNFILKIRLSILDAKLEMISGNLTDSKIQLERVLEVLHDISGSKSIKRFEDEVEHELNLIKEQYFEWKELLRTNVMLENEIKKDELMQYIEIAQESIKSHTY